ncbi:NHL repeat protein [Pelomyxa schiedti]|nr:NHL repeat protein [Pelomyxa schiedti]
MDAQGNIIVGDQCNHRIRKITKEGVTTVSGSSTGFVDGNAVSALFRNPVGIALGRSGEIWVADFGNHRIRKISATGLVSTVVGTGSAGYTDGLATQAQLYRPLAICVDNDGNLLVGHAGCIRKISSDGVVTTIAGTSSLGFSDGDGPAAQFGSFISSITVDRQNNLIVTDRDNHALRLVTPQGSVKTIYGRRPGSTKDDEESQFSPGGAAIDPVTGDMFVTDSNHHTIKRLHFSLP